MNYKHSYHAGNRADVIKHCVLIALLLSLQQKETGFSFIDTHAGAGIYDLSSSAARKTNEYLEGIDSLIKKTPVNIVAQTYLNLVRMLQSKSSELKIYPGSPLIAEKLLRPQDKIILNELHPEEYSALKKSFSRYANVSIHHRDAYEFLPAVIPPTTKRGLILIDPPYEKPDEEESILKLLEKSLQKWPQGIYLIWLPIKDKNWNWKMFYQHLKNYSDERILVTEFKWENLSVDREKLAGSSLVLINAPWQIEKSITEVSNWLMKNWHNTDAKIFFL